MILNIINICFIVRFIGIDKHPSAKFYQNSFYCFNCCKTGDIIQFVQYYFDLSFQEAMQKINNDFNLNLSSNTKIDYKKIREIENQRKRRELQKINKQKYYNKLCEEYIKISNLINIKNKEINILNWEEKVFELSKLQNKKEILNMEIDIDFDSF